MCGLLRVSHVRVSDGLRYHAFTLVEGTLIYTYRNPSPSPQKSDTCANPVPIPPPTTLYHPRIWRTAGVATAGTN
jgi:hypothetical protein